MKNIEQLMQGVVEGYEELATEASVVAIMSIGVPASGKSTGMTYLEKKLGIARFCADDIREELTGDVSDMSKNREVFDILRQRVAQAADNGQSFCIDGTNTVEKYRKTEVDRLREVGVSAVIGVQFDVSLEVALDRNSKRDRVVPEDVIERMHSQLAEGVVDESNGFDSVFVIDNN